MAGISSIGFEFTVSSVGQTYDTDVFLNVTKRREQILFRNSVGLSSANIGYVSGDALVPETGLSIADRSTSLTPNRTRDPDFTAISSASSFEISTDFFLLTDVFTDETKTITPIPLFFKHELSTVNVPRDTDGTVASGVEVMNVELLDHLLDTVETPELKVNTSKGQVFNNLENEFASISDYNVYYVRYKVKNGSRIDTYTDLLSNTTRFRVAEVEDLGPDMRLDPTAEAYLIEESLNGFVVTLPTVGDYAYKPLASSRLEVVQPTATSLSDPWFVRVSNGRFNARVSGNLYTYRVAEFLTQGFYPEPPVKITRDESSTAFTRSLIKLEHTFVKQDDTLGLYVDVQIANASGTALAAYSTDPALTGTTASNGKTYQYWDEINRVGIRSIDARTGIVDIDGLTLQEDYKVTSTYYFEETYYEYSLIDVNPVSNSQMLDSTLVIFVIPELAGTTSTQTLYYLLLDKSGKCVASNWTSFDNDTQALTNGNVLYYEQVPGYLTSPPPNEIFVSAYTVEGTGSYLILADVTVDEGNHPDNLVLIDSRRAGGGISDERYEEALVLNPELVWNWDQGNWDGVPYRGTATYLVEVPVNLLEGAGGAFRTNQVTDIVERHTAFGVYPLIKAYGPDILVSGITPQTDGVSFSWESPGFDLSDDLQYNIYSSTGPLGPWDLASGSPVLHVASGHDFTITGLNPDTIYYMTIVPGYLDGADFIPLVNQPIGPSYETAGGTLFSDKYKFKTFGPSVITDATIGLTFTVSGGP